MSNRFVAVGTRAAGPDPTAEEPAVVAPAHIEIALLALRAFVDNRG
jgi:hypothetical protein